MGAYSGQHEIWTQERKPVLNLVCVCGGGGVFWAAWNLDSGKKTKVLNFVCVGGGGYSGQHEIWTQERKPKFWILCVWGGGVFWATWNLNLAKKIKVFNYYGGGYSGNQITEFGLRKENQSFEFCGGGGGILWIKSQNVQNLEIILKIGIVFLKLHVDTGIIFIFSIIDNFTHNLKKKTWIVFQQLHVDSGIIFIFSTRHNFTHIPKITCWYWNYIYIFHYTQFYTQFEEENFLPSHQIQ